MAYADLTQDQKNALQAFLSTLRPAIGQFSRSVDALRAPVALWGGNIETILGELQAGDVIPVKDDSATPTGSDLADAQPLTKQQLVEIAGYAIDASNPADGANGSYNTPYHRARFVLAAGPSNI